MPEVTQDQGTEPVGQTIASAQDDTAVQTPNAEEPQRELRVVHDPEIEQDDWARTGMPPIADAGDEPEPEAVAIPEKEPEGEPKTPAADETPAATTNTASAPEVDYAKLAQQQAEYIRRQQEQIDYLMRQTGQAPAGPPASTPAVSGVPTEPGVPSYAIPAPTPPTAEQLAARWGLTADDPMVKDYVAQQQQIAQIVQHQQQALAPLFNDYQMREAHNRDVQSFNQWIQNGCPEAERPRTAQEADSLFWEFKNIQQQYGMQFTPFDVLMTLRKAKQVDPVQQARQEGYQQGLNKKQRNIAAGATSARPVARRVGRPEPLTSRQAFDQAWRELVS